MGRKEDALQVFDSGYNCSQAVFSAFCDQLGLDKETALKIATGFGGGMRRGEVCGAVTGALMAIGLKEGHSIEGDTETKNKAYELVTEFESKFEALNGSIICKKLLKYDVSIDAELEIIKEKDLFNTICPKIIEDAIDIVEEILALKE